MNSPFSAGILEFLRHCHKAQNSEMTFCALALQPYDSMRSNSLTGKQILNMLLRNQRHLYSEISSSVRYSSLIQCRSDTPSLIKR